MTTAKYGISAINQINNTKSGILGKLLFNQANSLRAVRVTSIVLDKTHPRFTELGEWNGLGTIEYEDVITPKVTTNTAKPLLGNNKTFPLVNEIVYLLSLPNNNRDKITSTITSYYINTVSLWNHPHHNAYPTNPNLLPSEQQQDYVQTELGSFRRITDNSSQIYLGNTFVEKANIHPLLPFEGDVIYEGRWGNSIRLGSTVTTKTNEPIGLNNWSTTGSSGDPIIIIRNGQGTQLGDEGWVPFTENINDNDSSIYLTSTQKIPLQSTNISYNSYSTQPQSLTEFSGKQIILNSGRLVFNSTNDHILLSSNKSVGLNAISSVNIDTPLTVIQSNKILLGNKDATEPLLYGNITQDLLQQLITSIKIFTNAVFTAKDVATINIAAKILNGQVTAIEKNTLPNIKSNISYTK
jgi:hypothetical protein